MACGFDGKGLIHPGQVAPANEAFTPSPDETARARIVVEAFAGNDGVVAVDGQMLDLPHLRAAQRTLARAMAAERVMRSRLAAKRRNANGFQPDQVRG